MALPTLWDCSLRVPAADPRAEVLLVEEDPPICLATLSPELLAEELLAEEEAPLTDEDEARRLLS